MGEKSDYARQPINSSKLRSCREKIRPAHLADGTGRRKKGYEENTTLREQLQQPLPLSDFFGARQRAAQIGGSGSD